MKIFLFNFIFLVFVKNIFSKDNYSNIPNLDKIISNFTDQVGISTINDNKNIYDYDFYNINYTYQLKLMDIPAGSTYKSNNTCVNFADIKNYNYSIDFNTYSYQGKIFPENFCYGLLTYNISRQDFFNIIEKNKSKNINFLKTKLIYFKII